MGGPGYWLRAARPRVLRCGPSAFGARRAKSLAVPSEKVGLCIAPSDPVNLRPVWSAVRARKPEPLPPKRVSYAWLPARQASTYRTLGSRTA